MPLSDLRIKIENRSAKLAVIGLGYVGLPVAALFAKKGFQVVGVDIKQDRVDLINSGISPIEGKEPGLAELISEVVKSGAFHATIDYKELSDADVVLIDVETPVNADHIPEYQALRSAVKSLSSILKNGALVVVESTVMPGTISNVILPIIEGETGMICNEDFYLGNCPERVMPGKLLHNLRKMSRVTGGGTQETAALMADLYSIVVEADVDTADWITAEIVKTAENTYRDVQIAFANEMALICEALGADVWRVRDLVRKSPGREMLLPGAGVGGHCIPKDPWLLASSVRESDVPVRLIPAAREINSRMPDHVFNLLKDRMGDFNKKRILILGYAYLSDSDDARNSPSEVLVALINNTGANIVIHDPFMKKYSGDMIDKAKDCDAVVLMTAHSEYESIDLKQLKRVMRTPFIIDGRNIFNRKHVLNAGFELVRLGDTSRGEK
jgi:UDP-N-acetyl-D-mannosaminuronic acid dehydrogenase